MSVVSRRERAGSWAGGAPPAGFPPGFAKGMVPDPVGLPPLADLREACSRRKRLIAALVRGPLRERRGTEWATATRNALGRLIERQLVRERRWMSPKPKSR